MADKNDENINRLWFERYLKEWGSSPETGYKTFDEYFLCPCCHFPTLTERRGYEICALCNWEDDGQDDHNADKVLGGPNKDYSLAEARENFKNYLTSYRPSDTWHFERTTVKKASDGKQTFDLTIIKREIIERYYVAMATKDRIERKRVLAEIIELGRKLS